MKNNEPKGMALWFFITIIILLSICIAFLYTDMKDVKDFPATKENEIEKNLGKNLGGWTTKGWGLGGSYSFGGNGYSKKYFKKQKPKFYIPQKPKFNTKPKGYII